MVILISLIMLFVFVAIFFYRLGRAQASVQYAKDNEGYIDQKNCSDCLYYHNPTEWLTAQGKRGLCDYCAAKNKQYFKPKEK